VACGASLPHLPRHPIHGALKWKPSGIPAEPRSCDHGSAVSSGFPSSDAGRGPVAPVKSAQTHRPPAQEKPMHYRRRERLELGQDILVPEKLLFKCTKRERAPLFDALFYHSN
jgi:hypothetical protein